VAEQLKRIAPVSYAPNWIFRCCATSSGGVCVSQSDDDTS